MGGFLSKTTDAEITMLKVEFEFTADECFVVVDGRRIASRIDGAWASLEPGFVLSMSGDYETITIEKDGVRVH
jgi:hypothetical protein